MFEFTYLFLVAATVIDIKTGKIPNALNASFWLYRLVEVYIDSGMNGVAEMFVITLAAFFLYIGLYIFKAMGAGDVKLIIVLACCLGIYDSLKMTFVSMILAIIYAFIKKVIKVIFHKDMIKKYLKVKMAPFITFSVMVLQLYSYISK